jgi:hypothetical protein
MFGNQGGGELFGASAALILLVLLVFDPVLIKTRHGMSDKTLVETTEMRQTFLEQSVIGGDGTIGGG